MESGDSAVSSLIVMDDDVHPLHQYSSSIINVHSIAGGPTATEVHGSGSGSTATTIEKIFECCVCTNFMHPPISQCCNGHTLCSTCKTRVHNRCPLCMVDLGDIRCRALEEIGQSLELPCRYSSLGCPEKLPFYSKPEHEPICNFSRSYNCPYAGSDCSVVGDISYLVGHLRDDHGAWMDSERAFNHLYKSNPMDVGNGTWRLVVYHCFGQHFCLHFEALLLGMAPVYKAFLHFMGDEREARSYSYSLKVGGNGPTFKGSPRSIRDSHKKLRDCPDGLIMSRNEALFFSGGDGKELRLRVTGRIWKEQQNPEGVHGSGSGSTATTIEEIFECPVCTNFKHPLIFQCCNGHTLCSSCKTRVHNRCPLCMVDLGDIRCRALEEIGQSLELPCRYSSLGCPEKLPFCSKPEHEPICNFSRSYNCPYAGSDCSVVGDISYLVGHLRDDHGAWMDSECAFNHLYKSNPMDVGNGTWRLAVYHCFGQHFCLHFEAPLPGMAPVYRAFLRFMGDEREARSYSYSLKVGGNGPTFKGSPRSIRDSHKKLRDSPDGLIISRNKALLFSGGDGKELRLRVTGRIWKEQQNPEVGVCIASPCS